jgi:hypothetical protein
LDTGEELLFAMHVCRLKLARRERLLDAYRIIVVTEELRCGGSVGDARRQGEEVIQRIRALVRAFDLATGRMVPR